MTIHYTLNPFTFVTATERMILLNTSPQIRASFAPQHRAIVDALVRRKHFTRDELMHLLAPSRIAELVTKRVLLEGETPPLEGRYSRQLGYFSLTSDNFAATQGRLATARVLVLGAGAIGSHVLWNLAAIGVGHLTIVDFDCVEESNLNRQLMYTPDDVGQSKVKVLSNKIGAFNPTIEITAIEQQVTSAADIARLADGHDLVIKAIDTPEESTAWLNEVCVAAGIPFIVGGFLDYIGVVGPIYLPGQSTCAACLNESRQVKRLHGTGATFAPLTTVVSSMVSMIAFKILSGGSAAFADKLLSFDADSGNWQSETIRPVQDCAVCGHKANAAPPPADPLAARLWSFRLSVLTLLVISLAVREGLGDRLAGIMTFSSICLSLPFLLLICGKDMMRARREIFLTAFFYIAAGAIDTLAHQVWEGWQDFTLTSDTALDLVSRAALFVVGAAISVTLMFVLFSLFLELARRSYASSLAETPN